MKKRRTLGQHHHITQTLEIIALSLFHQWGFGPESPSLTAFIKRVALECFQNHNLF
jgi:hypothetical protein